MSYALSDIEYILVPCPQCSTSNKFLWNPPESVA